jgi:hypothetical protein
MSRTVGPVLAIGGITLGNQVLLHNRPVDWRIPIATGISAGLFALLERLNEKAAVGLAWVALVTILLVRVDPKTPAPLESLAAWMKGNRR